MPAKRYSKYQIKMLTATSFNSELTLPGIFDIDGTSIVGNMFEFPSGGGLTVGNTASSRMIQTDQPVLFQFSWNVSGIMTHTFNPAFLWEIELLLEQYGPGEFNLGPVGKKTLTFGSGAFTPLPAGSGTTSFPGVAGSTDINIPAGTIPAGIYEAVAVIRLTHPAPTFTPCFLAAFVEYGKIQFYQEH